ncbi:pancreatic triacylglycerol lipase-like [Aricia agestis]|uniref:pancreatic triacylglycerol lipase-like n=1 Tax=Aricia agestis TaxID=91739 RepID=UPI001C20AB0F|nr:pancreatic triacylglycerol lipase-like [Aricia agestis]
MSTRVLSVFIILINIIYCAANGIFGAILYSDWIKCDHTKVFNLNVDDTQVFFYDFQNNYNLTSKIDLASHVITSTYNLDTTRKLIVFVPGYKSHISRSAAEIVRTAFKDIPNIYLMILDHSEYTSSKGGRIKSYERAVLHAYYIGRALGNLLVEFRSKGILPANMQLLGHSLGAHMIGYAAETYTDRTGETISRLTGIDPAGPCFSNDFIENQLRKGLADYVEVYHCNAGGLGSTSVLADTDFFINNGRVQRECSTWLDISDSAKCSHKACLKYWAETVNNPKYYLAWACDSYEDFSGGKCSGNKVTIGGYSNPGNETGVFYISTDMYRLRKL